MQALRTLWFGGGLPFRGEFYSTVGVTLEPYPAQRPGPPIWIGSWGSEAGLRRATPEAFAAALGRLADHLHAVGKDPKWFPNAIATMFFYVTEDRATSERHWTTPRVLRT